MTSAVPPGERILPQIAFEGRWRSAEEVSIEAGRFDFAPAALRSGRAQMKSPACAGVFVHDCDPLFGCGHFFGLGFLAYHFELALGFFQAVRIS